MSQPPEAPSTDHAADATGGTDALSGVLADVRNVDGVPLEDRAAVFERMHDVIAEALGRTLDSSAAPGAPSSAYAAGGGTR